MVISGISSSLLQQINNGATQTGDAVSIKMMREALDIQSAQAAQLINSVAEGVPAPAKGSGQHIDIKV
jgi:hypothetical protein